MHEIFISIGELFLLRANSGIVGSLKLFNYKTQGYKVFLFTFSISALKIFFRTIVRFSVLKMHNSFKIKSTFKYM